MVGGGNNIRGVGPVKVVIINTQYVETDAVSFKSVVQRLTGKDSTAAVEPPRFQPKSNNTTTEVVSGNGTPPFLSRGMSFKDFDRMLKELPPLDELFNLYAN
ncbi:hypothetical protein BUALT_Bualt03G0158200 [Buddleja alternifolia]|uniref:VQ domain-containing protein n=1 Tax=Buddleja alternifolia TaxID=168488 RepID=A0AAV6Y0S3_9LAMI|nr:hypothetical protein BUALT_Bualt03G0158200 [Buddleja alternifolia]